MIWLRDAGTLSAVIHNQIPSNGDPRRRALRVEVGVLTCRGDTWSIVVASRTDLYYTFRRSDGAQAQSGVSVNAGLELR